MGCPRCGSENITVVSEVTGEQKGYDCCTGGIGAMILGPIGWLCGASRMGERKVSTRILRVCNNCGEKFV